MKRFIRYVEGSKGLIVEWISKIPDVFKLPTRYFALVAIVTGSLLLLPVSLLERLHLDSIPAPYGAIIGLVFLVSGGVTVVNFGYLGFGEWKRRKRASQRKIQILETLLTLDPAEQAVIREFFLGEQSTVKMPLDNPVVAGLIARGVIQQVGRFGHVSGDGMMFSFRVSENAREGITPEILGIAQFIIPNDEGKLMLTDEGINYVDNHRPGFRWPPDF